MDYDKQFVLMTAICLAAAVLVINATAATTKDTMAKNTEILREINRLMALADADNLTLADMVQLGSVLSNKTAEEFSELVWMVDHGYQHHALHALQGIYWTEIGKEFPCPAETLSHASAYLQYNDTDRAKHAVEKGAEKLNIWEPIARADKAADQTVYPDLDNVISVMKHEIVAMKADNMTDVKADADFLDQNGYC